jgi:hypothetical protein
MAMLLVGAALTLQRSSLFSGVLLAVGAYLALRAGFLMWVRGPLRVGGTKETYWRGRRIDLEPVKRVRQADPALPPAQAALYLVLGAGLAVAALVSVVGGF